MYTERFTPPEEIVENYNAAVRQRSKAIALERDHSTRADIKKFLMNVIGKGYARYHNKSMSGVPKAQKYAERYAQDNLPALEDQAAAEARVVGKDIKLPFERE